MSVSVRRGEVWYADLSPHRGSEQGGIRPVLILQNDIGNKHSPTTIIAIITSRHTKAKLPTHVWLSPHSGLRVESMVELEQIRTIDKARLTEKVGNIHPNEWKAIENALQISFGMQKEGKYNGKIYQF